MVEIYSKMVQLVCIALRQRVKTIGTTRLSVKELKHNIIAMFVTSGKGCYMARVTLCLRRKRDDSLFFRFYRSFLSIWIPDMHVVICLLRCHVYNLILNICFVSKCTFSTGQTSLVISFDHCSIYHWDNVVTRILLLPWKDRPFLGGGKTLIWSIDSSSVYVVGMHWGTQNLFRRNITLKFF